MAVRKIEGLDELVETLKNLPKAIVGKNGGPVRSALYRAAKKLRDEARARAPYNEEGVGKHLRDQIILKRDPNPRAIDNAAERYIVAVKYKQKKYANNRRNRRTGRVGKTYYQFGDFYYWRHLEFGTSKMAPRPFLRPAFEANKDSLSALVRDGLAKAIAVEVRKLAKK